jgi:signal transduction histidine kinase
VRNTGGRPVCSVGIVEDISAHRDAESAPPQSHRLIEAVAEHVPVAMLACDQAHNITFYNRAAAELFSMGQRSADAPAPSSRYPIGAALYLEDGVTPIPFEKRPLARALRGETLENVEFVVVPRDGTPRPQLVNACPLIGPDGERLGTVSVSQDITQLRQAEAEIERIHKQLMDASRYAGMAEVATNVLHNVGNVLNSVNVSATLVADRLNRSKLGALTKVAELLHEHKDDVGRFLTADERGRMLPLYLGKLAEQLHAEREAVLEEIAALRANIDHIKDAVTMQQSYAKRIGVAEAVEVADLVDDSLRMNSGALTRHHVVVERAYGRAPAINIDKHKALQILVNLIRNAKYACDESGREEKRITVGIETVDDRVRISVIDNGIGIAPEHMSRLFSHGFTTRKSGHGFGLHSAALAAAELGGTLSAQSEGIDRGATFVLELPTASSEKGHG